ncbi:MAG TPA: host attachment protein [Novosphingobium sp.]|nr:host attachment protein [Novosphingobium sp.]
MQIPPNAHVAVVDGERFLLMRQGGGADPTLEFEDEPDVSESGESGAFGHHDTDAKSDNSRTMDKLDHAAGVAGWLNRAVLQHRIEQLLIVADPDTLGEMRRHYHKETEAALIGEIDKQLTGMPGPDIAKAIAAA